MFQPDDDFTRKGCQNPSHYPPTMMVFQRSGWWVCPSCGHRTRISVPTWTMNDKPNFEINPEPILCPSMRYEDGGKVNPNEVLSKISETINDFYQQENIEVQEENYRSPRFDLYKKEQESNGWHYEK